MNLEQAFTIAFDERRAMAIEGARSDVSVDGASGPASISTQSGDVTARDAKGPLSIRTASGDVNVSFAPGSSGSYARFDTASGDVELSFPSPIFRASLQTSTSSGDVSNSLSFAQIATGVPAIYAHTTSGDISIR